MTDKLKTRLEILVALTALVGFLLSLWNLWFTSARSLDLKIIPEPQVQLIEENGFVAFNVLMVLTASGPEQKWETIKFESATLLDPPSKTHLLNCRSYLAEEKLGQQNQSRNIPVAIHGGDAKIITAAFQASMPQKWQQGKYEIRITARNSAGKEIDGPKLTFSLSEHDLSIIHKPDAIYMKAVD